MDYLSCLNKIKLDFLKLNDIVCDTIEEADSLDVEYEKLMDDIISLIKLVLDDNSNSVCTKENIYDKSVHLLGSYIGCAVDVEKYGKIIDNLCEKGKITKQQKDTFYNNLNIGRWL